MQLFWIPDRKVPEVKIIFLEWREWLRHVPIFKSDYVESTTILHVYKKCEISPIIIYHASREHYERVDELMLMLLSLSVIAESLNFSVVSVLNAERTRGAFNAIYGIPTSCQPSSQDPSCLQTWTRLNQWSLGFVWENADLDSCLFCPSAEVNQNDLTFFVPPSSIFQFFRERRNEISSLRSPSPTPNYCIVRAFPDLGTSPLCHYMLGKVAHLLDFEFSVMKRLFVRDPVLMHWNLCFEFWLNFDLPEGFDFLSPPFLIVIVKWDLFGSRLICHEIMISRVLYNRKPLLISFISMFTNKKSPACSPCWAREKIVKFKNPILANVCATV